MLRHSLFTLVLAGSLVLAAGDTLAQRYYTAAQLPTSTTAINNLGGDTLHGFIYIDGQLVDVNALLVAPDGWQIVRTSAINEGRQIASLACRIDNEYQCMPALLSPVPEPAAPVLWSGGLLLLASRWVLRRPSARKAVDGRAA
jgi:hypothetical protein